MVQITASLNQTKTPLRKLRLFVACMALAASSFARPEDKDILDKMILDPNLKTFTNLIVKAGLVETIKAEGPLTVFAPNNAAFAKLPTATMTALMKDKALLRKTLTYCIFGGKVMTKDMKDGTLKMQSSELVTVSAKVGMPITVNGQKIVTPDIETSNGIIHVVGSVLVPPAKPTKTP